MYNKYARLEEGKIMSTTSLTTAQQAALGAFTGVMSGFFVVCAIIYYVLLIINLKVNKGVVVFKILLPYFPNFPYCPV